MNLEPVEGTETWADVSDDFFLYNPEFSKPSVGFSLV